MSFVRRSLDGIFISGKFLVANVETERHLHRKVAKYFAKGRPTMIEGMCQKSGLHAGRLVKCQNEASPRIFAVVWDALYVTERQPGTFFQSRSSVAEATAES